MSGVEFSTERILEQARGNQTATWYLAARRAREREGSVEEWARYVANDFAPSWDELGDSTPAIEVARLAALNLTTTADMEVTDLSGDDTQATIIANGPEWEWAERMGVDPADLDRINEVLFGAIAERRGLSYAQERTDSTLRMTFTRG